MCACGIYLKGAADDRKHKRARASDPGKYLNATASGQNVQVVFFTFSRFSPSVGIGIRSFDLRGPAVSPPANSVQQTLPIDVHRNRAGRLKKRRRTCTHVRANILVVIERYVEKCHNIVIYVGYSKFLPCSRRDVSKTCCNHRYHTYY